MKRTNQNIRSTAQRVLIEPLFNRVPVTASIQTRYAVKVNHLQGEKRLIHSCPGTALCSPTTHAYVSSPVYWIAFSSSTALETASPIDGFDSTSEDPGTLAHSLLYPVHLLDPGCPLDRLVGARGGSFPLADGGVGGLVEEDEDRDKNDPDVMSSQEAGPWVPWSSFESELKPPLGDCSPAS